MCSVFFFTWGWCRRSASPFLVGHWGGVQSFHCLGFSCSCCTSDPPQCFRAVVLVSVSGAGCYFTVMDGPFLSPFLQELSFSVTGNFAGKGHERNIVAVTMKTRTQEKDTRWRTSPCRILMVVTGKRVYRPIFKWSCANTKNEGFQKKMLTTNLTFETLPFCSKF